MIAAGAMALAASVFALRPAPKTPDAKTMRLSVPLPTGLEVSLEVPDITISPDGRMILFAAVDSSGTTRLYIRPIDMFGARPIPGTEGAVIPFWSPDSKRIAFFADGSLKRMSLGDDRAQLICPAPSSRGGAWGPGDVIVFAPTAAGPLMQVPASGGTVTPATTLDETRGETAHRFPQFLPDGKHFLYVTLPEKKDGLETRIGTLDANPGPVVLSSRGRGTYAAPGYLVYIKAGSVMAQPFDAQKFERRGTPQVIRDLGDAIGQYKSRVVPG